TGIATLSDIEEALQACRRVGNDQVILLKCVSEYPTPFEDANLRTIPNMIETFGVPVGLSDHTLGIAVPVAAVTLGAVMVEKHFILDRSLGGPDSAFSLEPAEFRAMVEAIRQVEKALGKVSYELTEKQKRMRKFSRSLFVAEDIKAGEVFTQEKVRSVRPGYGLHPRYLKEILGRRARVDIPAGTPLSWELIE
ncbi:MAG: N-acetylneuraminate synthase family protein, partial [Aquificaceae bacterium]